MRRERERERARARERARRERGGLSNFAFKDKESEKYGLPDGIASTLYSPSLTKPLKYRQLMYPPG